MSQKVKVFITYAREDVSKKDELIKRLGCHETQWTDKRLA